MNSRILNVRVILVCY